MKNAKRKPSPKHRARSATTTKRTSLPGRRRVTPVVTRCSTAESQPPKNDELNPSEGINLPSSSAWVMVYTRDCTIRTCITFKDLQAWTDGLYSFRRLDNWTWIACDAPADHLIERVGLKIWNTKITARVKALKVETYGT